MIKKILIKFRQRFFPTAWESVVKKYYTDGGDVQYRYDFDLDEDSTVLDFGGYKGQWASDVYSKYNCRILIFEPLDLLATGIIERFKLNGKIEVFTVALGANSRTESIGISDDGTSIFKDSVEEAMIKFKDARLFFEEQELGEVDLAKLNIEGGEYELLARLIETGLIKQIRHLQVQFHNINADSRMEMEKIWKQLELTHSLQFRYDFVWEGWIRID